MTSTGMADGVHLLWCLYSLYFTFDSKLSLSPKAKS
jgi:hypothetical protein